MFNPAWECFVSREIQAVRDANLIFCYGDICNFYPGPQVGTHLVQLSLKYPSGYPSGDCGGSGKDRSQYEDKNRYLVAFGILTILGITFFAIGLYYILYRDKR